MAVEPGQRSVVVYFISFYLFIYFINFSVTTISLTNQIARRPSVREKKTTAAIQQLCKQFFNASMDFPPFQLILLNVGYGGRFVVIVPT